MDAWGLLEGGAWTSSTVELVPFERHIQPILFSGTSHDPGPWRMGEQSRAAHGPTSLTKLTGPVGDTLPNQDQLDLPENQDLGSNQLVRGLALV